MPTTINHRKNDRGAALLRDDRRGAWPAWLARIGLLTTSRADSGIYQPLAEALVGAGREVVWLVGGTHHEAAFGETADEIDSSPGTHCVCIDHFVAGDSPVDVAETSGRAVGAFARAMCEQPIDLVFVLGDRTEMLAAALAATICGMPIAHLNGGDRTEGAYDDACRHAISKLAHVHFPAIDEHARRLAAMGESLERIHTVGSLAVDVLSRFEPQSKHELQMALKVDFVTPPIVLCYHPETLSDVPPDRQIGIVLDAVRETERGVIVIGTNADVGHGAIDGALREFAKSAGNAVFVPSMPQRQFWSVLAHCGALVGNSSAAMLEAPSLGTPAVNIGDRQKGRVRAANVIDVPRERGEIAAAIRRATSTEFKRGLAKLVNPYGGGNAAVRIVATLMNLPLREALMRKN